MLLRLPFLGSIGPDEGGYAYVALEWAGGDRLYRNVWIDRPQGLLLAYRAVLALGHAAWAIRVGAIVAAAAVTVLVFAAGCALAGRTAGILAAALYAVVGVGPHIEGFTFNGELAASVPAAAAVAAVARAARSTRPLAWLALAGLGGGVAVATKQSAFDGLAVAIVAAAAVRSRPARLLAVAAGGAVPLGGSLLLGALAGWGPYWTAIAGYRLRSRGLDATLDARATWLVRSASAPVHDLLPLTVLAGAAACVAVAQRRLPWYPLVWLAAALAGVNIGGLYWPHYYVQLVAPLALLAGIALAAVPRWAAVTAAAVVAAPTLLFVGRLAELPDPRADAVVSYARGFDKDEVVARWLRAHTRPRDGIYVLDSRADIYFLAGREAPFPYLWDHPLHSIPHALARLASLLAGPGRPRYVLEYQRPETLGAGRIATILRRDYVADGLATPTRIPVLEARGSD